MRNGQDRLQAVGGHDIAEIGQGNWNHPAGDRAGGETRQCKLRQRGNGAANRHQHGGKDAGDGDGAVFAEAVGDRADDELDRTMCDRISGDDNGRGADRGVEVRGDLRQQGIGDAHLRLAGKARRRQQHDRARRGLWRQEGRNSLLRRTSLRDSKSGWAERSRAIPTLTLTASAVS
jgi:hypothetical protein